jgi:hypothetical protein
MQTLKQLNDSDSEVAQLINLELKRQQNQIELKLSFKNPRPMSRSLGLESFPAIQKQIELKLFA